MSDTYRFGVFLSDLYVGELHFENERVGFRLDEEYIRMPRRPVLGQVFEDDLYREHHVTSGVPAWFANLLPEGALRELLARKLGVDATRSFFLLGALGEDLAGAVRVIPASPADRLNYDERREITDVTENGLDGEPDESDYQFKFSLAGMQLKFSVLQKHQHLTLPLRGQGGDVIVKLPDSHHPNVPENEWSMMTWARLSGITTADVSLVDVSTIEGLPIESVLTGGRALAIARFDRLPGGDRVHIEDFAQILNKMPTTAGKYLSANYETVAKMTLAMTGLPGLLELVRRLVANVAMGNGDAHLKNFSLIYPDGITPGLAPAYDLVSTVTYVPGSETLALNLARSKAFEDVQMASFRRMARKIGLPSEGDLDDTVSEAVARLQDTWPQVRTEMSTLPAIRDEIDRRLRILPLLNE